MPSCRLCYLPALRRPLYEPDLYKVGLVDLLDRSHLLADGDRYRPDAHGAAAEVIAYDPEDPAVEVGAAAERVLGEWLDNLPLPAIPG